MTMKLNDAIEDMRRYSPSDELAVIVISADGLRNELRARGCPDVLSEGALCRMADEIRMSLMSRMGRAFDRSLRAAARGDAILAKLRKGHRAGVRGANRRKIVED
jgi:hypothetical protein